MRLGASIAAAFAIALIVLLQSVGWGAVLLAVGGVVAVLLGAILGSRHVGAVHAS